MKNSLKILMFSGLLSLNALGSQTPSTPEMRKKAQSAKKRSGSPEQQVTSSSTSSSNPMNVFQPQEPDSSITQAGKILLQLRTPTLLCRPTPLKPSATNLEQTNKRQRLEQSNPTAPQAYCPTYAYLPVTSPPSDYMGNYPAAAASAASSTNLPSTTTMSNTNCGNQTCPVSKFTTEKMVLNDHIGHFETFFRTNTCRNKALHRINGEPLGFILLDKVSSGNWSEMLIRALNSPHGHDFFEHQDITNGKTALHKLVSNTSNAQIIKELYKKLAHYNTGDWQGHTPLYDAIQHLKDNYVTLTERYTALAYEKIKILLGRGATIDEKILNLVKTIPYAAAQNYINKLLQTTSPSSRQVDGTRDMLPAAASASSSSAIMIAPQQSVPEGAAAAAASSASSAQAQTQEDDGGVRRHGD